MSDTVDTRAVRRARSKKPKPGTFSSTHQPKNRRTADRIPHNVKADVVAGLAAHGEDGNGKGGFRGFVKYLAGRHPKQAARLIERLLPPSVVVATAIRARRSRTINIVAVPARALSRLKKRCEKLQSGPMLLEHEPQPEQMEQLEQLAELCEHRPRPRSSMNLLPEPPAPPSERDLIMQRAKALGYTPLPPRPRQG